MSSSGGATCSGGDAGSPDFVEGGAEKGADVLEVVSAREGRMEDNAVSF